ncbi:MAG: DUF3426 domain-containing protein [Proteobacteria bacterium]|nr:DUF3426 domain-containing protein [Pseudomonadota bacterium]
MIITCPECKTRYMMKSDKLGLDPKKVRCAKCKNQWMITPPSAGISTEESKPPLPPIARMDSPNLTRQQKELNIKLKKRKTIIFSIIFGFIATFLLLSIIFRESVVAFKPELRTIYDLIGFEIAEEEENVAGLVIQDVERRQETNANMTVLIFSGKIKNQSEIEVPVPNVKIQLFDEDGILLDEWTAQPEQKTLKPNQTTTWTCRFYDPPLNQISQFKTFFEK